ncbi:MAG: SDR family NAD(P)-dependent oxidoreductase [Actinomycetota bacterium]|nr:SDR family NAD(P)-dependent oxidoreductase [Actinomycetota bacterium]
MRRFDFDGATAVVTGAASGIGEALAHLLAERGAHVVLLDRDAEGLARVAGAVSAFHRSRTVEAHVVDVSDDAALESVAHAVMEAHPHLDLLVNNAGVAMAGLFEQMSIDDFEWVVGIDFRAPIRLTHHLLPALTNRPGAHVVNVSSIFGIVAPPGQTAYSASKFGLRGFSEALRSELRLRGAGVTTVHPGGVRTAIARNARAASGMRAEDLDAGVEAFERLLSIPPERAAALIVAAVERRRPRLLIGLSARIPALAARIAPAAHALAFRPILARSVEHQGGSSGSTSPDGDGGPVKVHAPAEGSRAARVAAQVGPHGRT